jgi:hypothetical protein
VRPERFCLPLSGAGTSPVVHKRGRLRRALSKEVKPVEWFRLRLFSVVGAMALVAGVAPAQEKGEASLAEQGRVIRPLIARYCLSCHGAKKARGGLNLEPLQKDDALTTFKVWAKV